MIVIETLSDGRTHTYSDAGYKIMQETGAIYDDAIDVAPHTYTETDIPIDSDTTAEEVLSVLLGGAS